MMVQHLLPPLVASLSLGRVGLSGPERARGGALNAKWPRHQTIAPPRSFLATLPREGGIVRKSRTNDFFTASERTATSFPHGS